MPLILVVQRRSAIGEKEAAFGTLRALGLGRPGQRAHLEDTPQLRGMLRKVAHLVDVEAPAGKGTGGAGAEESEAGAAK